MSYRIDPLADGRSAVALEGEPPYCRALEMGAPRLEEELRHGLWLVLAFAVWSVPDRRAVGRALDAVKRFEGRIGLGVRPFADAEEMAAWRPDGEVEAGSPVWLFLRDGEVEESFTGIPGEPELAQRIARRLEPDPGGPPGSSP